jgi:hypothetical protein
MSWWKCIVNFFRKKPEPKLTPAEHAQHIRDAIPAACLTFDGLQDLKARVSSYAGQDRELFNALNRTLPITAPSTPDRFEYMTRVCDMIEDGVARDDMLKLSNMVGY